MVSHLAYFVIRSKKRRKTISLHIKEDGRIIVHAPCRTPESEIEEFVKRKQSWVSQKLMESAKKVKPVEKKFLSGEEFFYLGERFPLEIQDQPPGEPPLRLSFGKFVLSENRVEEARDLFVRWYKKEAKDKLAKRVDYYSNKFHLFPKGIKITSAKSRWGSCSRDNRLCLSWRIMMAPLNIVDYVLTHELVHVKEKNHSRRFWNHLESIIPDSKKHRRWLAEHENQLRL
jgi:predicted metal-dependent hydrolase